MTESRSSKFVAATPRAVVDFPCPGCGDGPMRVFFALDDVPVFCNVLWPTEAAARAAPRAAIRLGYCAGCQLIYNVAFDPARMAYSDAYENSLHCSARFQQYAEGLAIDLIDRYGLRGKTVVEIGSGQGEFLRLLCDLGGNRGVGFDPSFDPKRSNAAAHPAVTIIPEPYSEAHLSQAADLICCRHVLEHIEKPLAFLRSVRKAIGGRHETVVFFEVPNILWTLRDLGIWDIIYEHCSYFSAASLRNLFVRAGFTPLGTEDVYGGQFVCIDACPAGADEGPASAATEDPGDMESRINAFREVFETKTQVWREQLVRLREDGGGVVLWGTGSKGVTFLNVLGLSTDVVEATVDLNPAKHGRYVPGTGQRVLAPEDLRARAPRHVIVMNPLYLEEIGAQLRALGLEAQLLSA